MQYIWQRPSCGKGLMIKISWIYNIRSDKNYSTIENEWEKLSLDGTYSIFIHILFSLQIFFPYSFHILLIFCWLFHTFISVCCCIFHLSTHNSIYDINAYFCIYLSCCSSLIFILYISAVYCHHILYIHVFLIIFHIS